MDAKKISFAVGVGLAVLMVAGPASAKIGPIVSTTVHGPGFTGTTSRGAPGIGTDDAMYFAEHSGLMDEGWTGAAHASLRNPPIAARDLGPSYEVTFTFMDMNERTGKLMNTTSKLTEWFFPYAAGGALTFVPGGQTIAHDGTVPITLNAHWAQPSGYFLDGFNLDRMGFPKGEAPAAAPASKPVAQPVTDPVTAPARTPVGTWIVVAAIVAFLALGSAIARRKQHTDRDSGRGGAAPEAVTFHR
jgi:hypothetical protein